LWDENVISIFWQVLDLTANDITERKFAELAIIDSKNNLKMAQKVANIGSWNYDFENNDFICSDELYNIFELEKQDVDLDLILSNVVNEDLEIAKNMFTEVINNKKNSKSEFKIKRHKGSIKHIYGESIIEFNEDKSVKRIYGIMQDITERKLYESELKRTKFYLNSVIESMPSAIIGLNSNGIVTSMNSESERYSIDNKLQAIGTSFENVFPIFDILYDDIRNAIKSKKQFSEEKIKIVLNGEIIYINITIYPLLTSLKPGFVLMVNDITDRVRIEEVIIQSEKMMSVGGLAAGMAHEINNPLAGILQNSQVLNRRLLDPLPANLSTSEKIGVDFEKVKEYIYSREIDKILDAIKMSGYRAAKIVTNMLNFSRQSFANREFICVNDIIDESIELASHDYDLKNNYDFKQIEIEKKYDPKIEKINCSKTEIEQVIFNILKNGAQAMSVVKKENYSPLFTISTFLEDEFVIVEIKDNGPGMSQKIRKRIFEPFYTTKEVGKGTGLGLSVSYFIITENHKGSLLVESIENKGTMFRISLPLEKDNV